MHIFWYHIPMSGVTSFLRHDEAISDTLVVSNTNSDYSVHTLERPGLRPGEEVLIEVRSRAEPYVLVGGNPLEIKVVQGVGQLAMVDLSTGTRHNVQLERGRELEIPPTNTLYWYESTGEEPLVVRDHCDGFDPAHEPVLATVAGLIPLFSI